MRVWHFGDNVDTDQIIPAKYLVTADNKELGSHAFELVRPEFAKGAMPGDIIVAGDNFGCGSSREHAVRAFMGLGIKCVVARSFARIFYRNCINLGLLCIECAIGEDEDRLELDYDNGKIRGKREYSFPPPPDFIKKIIADGGIVEHLRRKNV
jgi:3-isopropylmalate/(R)-2-methylmalate dehydratase small subunit